MSQFSISTKFDIGDDIFFITKTEDKIKANFSIRVEGPFPVTEIRCGVRKVDRFTNSGEIDSTYEYDVKYVINKAAKPKEILENDAMNKDEAAQRANAYIMESMS